MKNTLFLLPFYFAILFLTFIESTYASTCEETPYSGPIAHQQQLDSGITGQWNSSFDEKLISIQDIDGNTWQYFALEKRPDTAKALLIFLHGFPEFAWAWEEQLDYFGTQYHSIALDLKGHHYSSRPDEIEEYDFIELAWELEAIIDCLGYEKAVIIGHDFGGTLAWMMGMLHPNRVQGLVVLSVPHPYLFGRALLDPQSDQEELSRYIDYARGTTLSDQLSFSKIIFSDFSIFESGFYSGARIFRLMVENWIPTSHWKTMKHYYRAMPYPADEQNYPAQLTQFQKKIYSVKRPTLLLRGLSDPYFSDQAYQGMEELITDLEYITYPNGTHWLHHEAEDLNQRIETFLHRILTEE